MTSRYQIIASKLSQAITQSIASFRNALPHCCLLCNEQTQRYQNHLCNVCRDDLPFPMQLCVGCASQLMTATKWCGRCQQDKPAFILVTACYYQPPIKQLLSALKYRNQTIVCHELARHLARRVYQLINQGIITKPQALMPVPLHWRRQMVRGFNQAQLIAQELSLYLNIPVINTIKRCKPTLTQTQLDAQQRQHNLDDAFKLSMPINVQSIAIVDDVYTTGATMREISETILSQQTITIQHWAITRTIISG